MIAEYYSDHGIAVNSVSANGRWNAEVRIPRTLCSGHAPRRDDLYKLRPDHAEHSALSELSGERRVGASATVT
jgi:hypothetical protein